MKTKPMKPIAEMLDEVQARADAATAGPLETGAASYQIVDTHGALVAEMMTSTSHERDNDAAFFAAARSDVPRLVEALRHALQALDSIPCAYLPREHISTIVETPREIQAIMSKP